MLLALELDTQQMYEAWSGTLFVHPHTVCVELSFTSHKLFCEGSCQISQSWKATIEHKMCQQKGNKREEARSRYEGSNQKEEAIALLVGIPFQGEVWSELWREAHRGKEIDAEGLVM